MFFSERPSVKVIVVSVSSAIAVALVIVIGAILSWKKILLHGKSNTSSEALMLTISQYIVFFSLFLLL